MELRQLRYFVAVAEELHFARAATRLLITSPTLSQQVKVLERDLGVRLFERGGSGVALTPAGIELLPLARQALTVAEDLEETARRLSLGRATTLRVGFLSFSLTAPVRRLLTEFGRREPTVDLQLRQYEWDDPSAGLATGSSDVALLRPPFTASDCLNTVEVGQDRLVAVMAEDHELAGLPSLRADRLAEVPFLETRIVTDPVFADYWYLHSVRGGRARTVTSRATTVEEWIADLALGRGVNLVPAGMVEEYRKPGLAFVPVEDLEPSRLVLAWEAHRETDTVRRFVALVQQLTGIPQQPTARTPGRGRGAIPRATAADDVSRDAR